MLTRLLCNVKRNHWVNQIIIIYNIVCTLTAIAEVKIYEPHIRAIFSCERSKRQLKNKKIAKNLVSLSTAIHFFNQLHRLSDLEEEEE